MMLYIPASFNDQNSSVSWTGNYDYSTVTIRGIFSTREGAVKSLEGWAYADDCYILERCLDDFDDDGKEIEYKAFDIELDDGYLYISSSANGDYEIDKMVDESCSAIYDPEGTLGVIDY